MRLSLTGNGNVMMMLRVKRRALGMKKIIKVERVNWVGSFDGEKDIEE